MNEYEMNKIRGIFQMLESQNTMLAHIASEVGIGEATIDRFAERNRAAWREFFGIRQENNDEQVKQESEQGA